MWIDVSPFLIEFELGVCAYTESEFRDRIEMNEAIRNIETTCLNIETDLKCSKLFLGTKNVGNKIHL